MSGHDTSPGTRPGIASRLSVQRWVHLILAVFVLIVCAGGLVGGLVQSRISDRTTDLVDRIQPARSSSFQLQNALLEQETGVRGFALTGDATFLRPYEEGMRDESLRLARVRALVGDEQPFADDLDRIAAAAREWRGQHAEPLVAAVRRDGPASESSAPIRQSKDEFDTLRRLYKTQQAHLDVARDLARADLGTARTTRDRVFIALVVGFLAAVVALGLLLHRMVGRPLSLLAAASDTVRSGAFRNRIEVGGPSDVRAVAAAVEDMRRRIVGELADSQEREQLLAEQAQELRRSNAELEQFAYVASHDLQEPLRKVASFCRLLEKRCAESLDGRARQYIDYAVDGATRMQVLIDDLLAFSRVGRVHDKWKPVGLDRTLDRALADLALVVEESGATVVRESPLPEVTGDATALSMVWQNLIGNAVKFRRPDVPCRITVGCVREGEDWHFCVSDNGIGIAPEFAQKVFVIFQRLHGRDEYEGTGIGLALCRKIVEVHGGRIWLDEESSEGTRIRFTLPVSPAAPARSAAEHPLADSAAGQVGHG
ncbi:ATP-binding protein [Streptomyces sp. NPDC087769]|uniref:sensor histidine kinase n=1 Tax=unclassified Streptomyces TaxID=2593676 RepID=UPI000F5BE1B6|nr:MULTISPECIES: sensor histidine kinase [unclassified Streptomyces]MCX4392129.1 CHASE3 domain-containing protein [Streptomyces sp. NBC_01767]RPK65727.1 Phytochrome-like protein cph1 [Streptomyces sp. ADI95-17]WSP45057.1 CHASE3 domain-containing protein [Streptomyces sp. NBC_01243]WSX05619.1 CHASE3 domain-containing protein [Streptomyces sp. NBC_00987]